MRRWAAEAMPPGGKPTAGHLQYKGQLFASATLDASAPAHTRAGGKLPALPRTRLAAAPDSGGAPYRKYHSTRHSFATWLLEGQPSRSPRMHALNFRAGTPKFRGLGDLRVVRQGRATLSEIPRDPPHVRHVAAGGWH